MSNLIAWIIRSLVFGSVMLYGALGELLTEKAGNLNLGTPGIVCIGGAFGFAGAYAYEYSCLTAGNTPVGWICIVVALLCGFVSSVAAGALYCFLTTTLKANQNVTGLTLTTFGVGFATFLGRYAIPAGAVSAKADYTYKAFSTKIPFLGDSLGWVSEVFFSYGFMMYLAIAIAIVMHIILKKTRVGLNLRAVGEKPATADAAGINVSLYKYVAVMLGSGISGLGGVYYVLDYGYGTWATDAGEAIEALAWLSVALVIFTSWEPLTAIIGSYLFGLCFWAYMYVPQILNIKVNTHLAQMLPYIVTIIILIIGSLRSSKEKQGPASLGLSYFREDR